jgi:hypothetical protein
MSQMIFGNAFTQAQYNELRTSIKSSVVIDNIKQGATPGNAPDGVLCTFRSSPVAFHTTPTLNNMVFSKLLWQKIMDNKGFRSSLELKSHYGTLDHEASAEVNLKNVANRLTTFEFGPKDLIVADVDVLDTPNGLIAYNLCKSGHVGLSTRGYGELKALTNGLQEVIIESYNQVSTDFVALPACSAALVTFSPPMLGQHFTQEDITEDLRRLVSQGLQRWGNDPLLLSLDKLINSGRTSYSIPSTVSIAAKMTDQTQTPQNQTNQDGKKIPVPSVSELNHVLQMMSRPGGF